MVSDNKQDKSNIENERWELLKEINNLTEKPLIILSIIWLILIIIEFQLGLTQQLEDISNFIWVLFILDFFIEFIIAPNKIIYLKYNWLIALSMFLPAIRVFRIFKILRLTKITQISRSLNLARFLTSSRRAIRAINTFLSKYGFGYILILTVIIIFAGAGGMAYFESPQALYQAGYTNVTGLENYADALWWTAMVITTMGSEYWPNTVEGRILCWLLALYAFTFFGYITSTIASYLIGLQRKDR